MPEPKTASFFVNTLGKRLVYVTVQQVFHRLVRRRAHGPLGQRRPRLHDIGTVLPAPPWSAGIGPALDVEAQLPLLSTWLGHAKPENTYWYLSAVPELLALAATDANSQRGGSHERARPDPGGVVHRPAHRPAPRQPEHRRRLSRHLATAVAASPSQRTGKQPSQLDIADLDAHLVGEFLNHLEQERHNSVRTRNARLAAIRSFFRYASLRHPEHAGLIARVLDIPTKRCERKDVRYLDQNEVDALLDAPDRSTWTGRRDHALLAPPSRPACGSRS